MIRLLTITPEEQRERFLTLRSRRDLANLLEVKYGLLIYHLYKYPDSKKYTTFEIPKKSGGKRLIQSPITPLKIIQQKLNEVLVNTYRSKPSVFSYLPGKNIVINASKHRNRRYVFNLDLEEFFPSINFGRVRGLFLKKPYYLPEEVATTLAQICCIDNHLPQGAPTSPIISNMICAKMDSELQDLAKTNKCYYTRYADDLTFSTSVFDFPEAIAKSTSISLVEVGKDLEKIILGNGFKPNKQKIRMQVWFRRQQVTGLTVNEFPNVRRNYIRQVRAMLYAWDIFGLENAERDFFLNWDNKHRSPNLPLPRFKQIIKGKIEFLGMVRGVDNSIYIKFRERYLTLSLRDEGIPIPKNITLANLQRPYIFVEGNTDLKILSIAWKKLFGDAPLPFVIKISDPIRKASGKGGSGGAGAIKTLLNGTREEASYITIGIFDRDQEGMKEYSKLDSDYEEDTEEDWKISKARKSGAILLPVPSGREGYVHFENLCVEFLFTDDTLAKKTSDGRGLSFSYPPITVLGKELDEDRQEEILETRKIVGGKKTFTDEIVPALDKDEFDAFRILFIRILELINVLGKNNNGDD